VPAPVCGETDRPPQGVMCSSKVVVATFDMSPIAAFRDGYSRVWRAPMIVVGLLVFQLALALPLMLALRAMLVGHLGESLAADRALAAVNHDWWEEFRQQAVGLGVTFVPSIMGFGAVLKNLSDLVDNRPLPPIMTGVLAASLVLWLFLSGGILDRFARNRPTRAHGFFSACGAFFFRFMRLGVIALGLYWLLFARLHPLLFDTLYTRLTLNVTVERTGFLIRLGLYLLFGSLLVFINLILDYAKVRIVVEDRRSVLGALLAAWRFVRRRLGRTIGLYALNALVFLLIVLIYALVAPGATTSDVTMWLAFIGAQLYLLARLVVRLQFASSQIALFQGELAHADYVSAPLPVWPDSPAAEAVAGEPREAPGNV
jgi:hypothetical protein